IVFFSFLIVRNSINFVFSCTRHLKERLLHPSLTFKNINRLAIPALLAGIAEPILSATDAAVVGNIPENSTEALAAVGIVGSFLSALIWVLGQTRSAISAIIAQ